MRPRGTDLIRTTLRLSLNRWLNPWYAEPGVEGNLPPALRLLRAALISFRNISYFLAAVALFGATGRFLPTVAQIAVLLGIAAALYLRVHIKDRRGEEVSPALVLGLFLLLFTVMAYARSLADQSGFHARYDFVIDGDRAIFGVVPTVWLQEHLHSAASINPLDLYASSVYFSYFAVPALTGVVLWHLNPGGLRLYLAATIVLICLSNLTFTLVPTAPPWLASLDGHLPSVARIAPEVMDHIRPGFYERGYQAVGVNDVAAFPSLHTAQTLLIALVAWRFNRWLGVAASFYAFSMGFSLVYLGEHYASDVLAGALLAVLGWAVALRITPLQMAVAQPSRVERIEALKAPRAA